MNHLQPQERSPCRLAPTRAFGASGLRVLGALLSVTLAVTSVQATPPMSGQGHERLVIERPLDRSRVAPASQVPRLRQARERWRAVPRSGPVTSREVLGYLPYWQLDYEVPYWELLTILAIFAVDVDGDGEITAWHGMNGVSAGLLVDEARANGVIPIVTITLFSSSQIALLVNDPARRAQAIASCLEVMAATNTEGINIDFETVPLSGRDGFVAFMAELKAAVTEAQPHGWDGHVSIAGPSVDWEGAYDYDVLLESTDGIMVMAYGYHWSGSDPGPVSPLYGGGDWSTYAIDSSVDDYLTWGEPENRHKVLLGLPWYGYEWPVASEAVPGTALGGGSSITFSKAEAEAAAEGKSWEAQTATAYYHIVRDGQLHQVWYDDGQSFAEKVAYVEEMDLGGVGIWALGYDAGSDDLWMPIAETFAPWWLEGGEDVVETPDVIEEAEAGSEPDTVDVGPEIIGPDLPPPDVEADETSPQPEVDVSPEPEEDTGALVPMGDSTSPPYRRYGPTATARADGCSAIDLDRSPLLMPALLLGLMWLVRRRRSLASGGNVEPTDCAGRLG